MAEDIEAASDLSRRIGLDRGPTEVVALAASFDAMLDRLEHAAETQRRLIEETSHELRTPLAVLMTNADVLLAHPEPTRRASTARAWSGRAAAAAPAAGDDRRAAGRRPRAGPHHRPAAGRPGGHRPRAVDEARVLAAARASAVVAGPTAAGRSVDEPTVRRAVANLVDNAIRYAPAGTAVEVDVEVARRPRRARRGDRPRPGHPGRASRSASSSGSGAAGPTPAGTGLGLPIARQVALAHGGDLTRDSPGPAGDGAVFRLTLALSGS